MLIAFERIAADEFRKRCGLMRLGLAVRAHFVKNRLAPRARHLPSRLASGQPAAVSPGLQFILATRHLERIADHATNIAEDIIFWVRGLDVRHGRGLVRPEQPADIEISRAQAAAGVTPGNSIAAAGAAPAAPAVENFHR